MTQQEYNQAVKDHEKFHEGRRPKILEYATLKEFERAMSDWSFAKGMTAPNKPGYYRANNN